MAGFSLEPEQSMRRWVELSPCGRYRYTLGRRWTDGPLAVFVGANPSTADASVDDATVRKWIGFCRRWGTVGGFVAVNLYAWRSRDPRALPGDGSAVGPENDVRIIRTIEEEDPPHVVACWGDAVKHMPGFRARVDMLCSVIGPRVKCWGATQNGNPKHPLMLGYFEPLRPWQPPTHPQVA